MFSLRARRERKLAALDTWRQIRTLVGEDVTVFGEQLAELHVETLADELDEAAVRDYQQALRRYDDAKLAVAGAENAETVLAVNEVLDDGRFHLACVLARRDGVDLPTRREPCFFNPQHGPAVADLPWTPPGGVERTVPVCRSDARRLTGGEDPEIRLVRVGDRWVPWHEVERARGIFTATIGSMAVEGVPKYVRLDADMARSRDAMGDFFNP
ncbi:MAG: hypothetical protein ACRDOM_07125 [Nocardioides sp.]